MKPTDDYALMTAASLGVTRQLAANRQSDVKKSLWFEIMTEVVDNCPKVVKEWRKDLLAHCRSGENYGSKVEANTKGVVSPELRATLMLFDLLTGLASKMGLEAIQHVVNYDFAKLNLEIRKPLHGRTVIPDLGYDRKWRSPGFIGLVGEVDGTKITATIFTRAFFHVRHYQPRSF